MYSNSQYLDRLKEIDILPMYLKFIYNDLVLFHKIIYKIVPIDIPQYLVLSSDNNTDSQQYFQRQTRTFNDDDRLKIKSKVTPRIDAFKHSYFQRSYSAWNGLPFDLRSIRSSDRFRAQLKEHLWPIANENLGAA